MTKFPLIMLLSIASIASSQVISLSGTVTNSAGQPLQGVIVNLIASRLSDTTDANGAYSLLGAVSVATPRPDHAGAQGVFYRNNSFIFNLASPAFVKITLFDARGALLATAYNGYLARGTTKVPFSLRDLGRSMVLMRLQSGEQAVTCKINPLSETMVFDPDPGSSRGPLQKTAASDWLQATKSGYASYMEQLTVLTGTKNITLSQAATSPDFGPNVYIFDPSQDMAAMQSQLSAINDPQLAAQFGGNRYALLFKPGSYSLDVNVGFYTEVLGLGTSPDSVQITGQVHSEADWMGGNATCTFWRACAGICVTPTSGLNRWAASQGAPVRRMHIKGDVALDDGGWSSGGFFADSKVDGTISSGSQQQYFSRNDAYGTWSGGNWNMVFVGVTGAPASSGVNRTVVAKTPLIAEKPFLVIDKSNNYSVIVPDLRRDSTAGVSWANGATPGTRLPIDLFYITKTSDNAASINAALSQGKNLLFTPGHYNLESTVLVTRPGTIVLGIGYPTLVPTNGNVALKVSDVDGVKVGGFLLEGCMQNAPVLLEIGDSGSTVDHSKNPTCLYDIFCRVGGQYNGLATCFVMINSNDVIYDHTWLWRADHGTGAGWNSNKNANGLIVNGNNVTVYGLFVEHTQAFQTWWNGNNGRTFFYQSEMPYDPPDNASWSEGNGILGFPSYKVSDGVLTHEAWGLGVYSVFRNDVVSTNAFEVPANAPGVKMHHLVTEKLGGGEITHVINGVGGVASSSVLEYP
ncbi:MAG TPA: carboxypeptidase-like regulatory domain-containing protein [Chitinivibrionales bacterium]|nr:carboxypeptidase-like regulatory domain-containing protein [Chitinivibrionales bacterium]